MNNRETIDRLITLAERLLVENDVFDRTLSQIEVEGDLPKELVEARVMLGLMGKA